MSDKLLLDFLKDKKNYKNVNYIAVQGILNSKDGAKNILKEIKDMMIDNYQATNNIFGIDIINLAKKAS